MRIAPVVVPHLRAPSPAVWADAALAGMVTHNDRTSNACSVAIAALVWAALAVLERHAGSPREAIVRAVNDTWDNDTIGAVVGAIVGALHGRRALPQEWIDGLLGRTGADDDGRVFELIEETKRFLRGAAGV